MKVESPVATTTPDEDENIVSTTSSIDGIWESPCTANGGWGMQLSLKVENGTTSNLLLLYPGRTDCSGNPVLMNMVGQDEYVTDYPTPELMLTPTISGVPTGFNVWGEDGEYGLTYKIDDTHMQYLVATAATNAGSTWNDWLTGTVDVAGFFADPENFTPTVPDSFNIALTKVSSSFTPRTTAPTFTEISGVWNSVDCADDGGNGAKRTLIFQTNGENVLVTRNWAGDTTCSGPPTSFGTNIEILGTIDSETTLGRYEYHSRIDAYNLDIYGLIMLNGDYLIGSVPSGSNDGTSIPNRHIEMDMNYIYTQATTANNASLYGTWLSVCVPDNGTSTRVTVTYSAPNVFSSPQETWNTNDSCTGPADSTTTVTGTYNIGPHYKGGVEYDIHINGGGDIYFVALIYGDYMYSSTGPVGPNDGSTPQLRVPFIGGADFYYTKQ